MGRASAPRLWHSVDRIGDRSGDEARLMADLADLLLEFAPSDDIAGVCEGLARAVVRCANSGFAAVVAAAAEDGSFDAYGDSGAPWRFLANVQGTFNRARQSGDPAQRAYTELTAVYVSDVQTDEECRAGFAATSAAFGVRSVFAVPLLADGSCVGVAAAYFSEAGAIDDATLGAFRILAAHGGVAIARARRFERLEGETEQLDALVAETAEGFCTLNDRMAVVLWNRAAERITGVNVGELAGKKLAAAFTRVEVPACPGAFESFDALADAFVKARSHTIEVELHRDHAEPIWLSMAGASVGGRTHRRSLVCCFRDITEQKRLEGLRSEFVSLVTHQLRTPLTSIRGYAELLGAVEMPSEQVMEFGTVIANASTRLANSITDVMDFERLIASRAGLRVAQLRLSDVFDAALAAIDPSPRHAVRVDAEAKEIFLEADLDRLTRAFAHLIGNADRYWPGDGEIAVNAVQELGGVSIAIVDHGPGIADTAIADLFSPYHHAARKQNNASQGLGLGLSLSKRIVEAHGGRIAVEPTPGGGATVRVWLPSS
jgi:PAS domain S-box-containing protein